MGLGIGPDQIRVWRQGEDLNKPPQPFKKKKKSQAKMAKTAAKVEAKAIKKTKAVSSESLSHKPSPGRPHQKSEFEIVEKRIIVALKLAPAQMTAITRMFEAPRALARLLKAHVGKISTSAEASLFLLKNRKQLDGFIDSHARTESVDLLTELLIQWSNNPPEVIGIDFSEDCSISASQEIYLPIEGFRCLAVAEPANLAKKRIGSQYGGLFTLFEHDKGFSVSFNLCHRIEVKSMPLKPPPGMKLKDWRPPEIRLVPGQPLPYINRMRRVKPEHRPRQRVLYTGFAQSFGGGGLRSMNWVGLSGWGVSGGLPSLGKGSR